MSTRSIKNQVLALLAEPDVELIIRGLAELPAKDVINALFSGICRSDEVVRWHAVSCMGRMVARLAEEDFEEARIIMRRLLWSLNDESGGIGWGAPETMAEIMICNEKLAEEYAHMLLSYMREDGDEPWQDGNYLEHETLQQGLLWGAGRLAMTRKQLMMDKGMAEDLPPYLDAGDGNVRGLAVRAMGLLGAPKRLDRVRELSKDFHVVRLYEDNAIVPVTVAELADKALQRLVD
jgi:HEAT repeat protein